MSLTAYPTLFAKLANKKYRRAFVSASVRHGIALQLRALRKRESWSQKDLGEAANKPQNVISRLEDPSYGKMTVQTLLDLAAVFDVALIVRFATFGELATKTEDLSGGALTVPSFPNEIGAESFSQMMAKSILANIGIAEAEDIRVGSAAAYIDARPMSGGGLGSWSPQRQINPTDLAGCLV